MTAPMPQDNVQQEEPAPSVQANRYSHGIAVSCPHCKARCIIRTSRKVTETYREAWAICPGCGFKGKAHVAWDAEASPSLLPDPRVSLPRIPYNDAVDQFATEELRRRDQRDMFADTG